MGFLLIFGGLVLLGVAWVVWGCLAMGGQSARWEERTWMVRDDDPGFPPSVHHREAGPSDHPCATCSYLSSSRAFCEMFGLVTGLGDTCDEWAGSHQEPLEAPRTA